MWWCPSLFSSLSLLPRRTRDYTLFFSSLPTLRAIIRYFSSTSSTLYNQYQAATFSSRSRTLILTANSGGRRSDHRHCLRIKCTLIDSIIARSFTQLVQSSEWKLF
jgi:hypothetical protein